MTTKKPADVLKLLPKAAREAAQAVDPKREEIEITTNEFVVNDAVIAALVSVPGIYTRNHQLVEILECEADDAYGQGPAIRVLTLSRIRELASNAVQFWRLNKKKEVIIVHPPDWAIAAVHGRGNWPGVRPIVGVIEAPALRPDGTVIQDAGYDLATGYVLAPSLAFPRIAEAPTRDDARKALAELLEVFADFPHATDADRCTVVAALLTILARPAIRGSVPAFILRATTPGSGKGLQADVLGTIANGRPPAKMGFPSKEEEREKVLGAYALRGAGVICFDNLAGGFGGSSLDRCLTAIDTVELRILGKSEIHELKWRAIITATGNNPELFGDTPRRVLQSTLEPSDENPEERDAGRYRHHPLLPWVLGERARLVVAGLTLLRAHALAGRPTEGCRMWGSFEAWSQMIPTAIVWAGGADPMLTRPVLDATADAGKQAAAELLRCWAALDPGTGLTSPDVIKRLYPADRREYDESPLYTDARAAIEALCRSKGGRSPEAPALGYALRKLRKRTIGGMRIDIVSTVRGSIRWAVSLSGGDGDHGGHVFIPRVEESQEKDSKGAESKTSSPSPPSPPGEPSADAREGLAPRPTETHPEGDKKHANGGKPIWTFDE